ncbi:PREDICTED: galactosylceramide sulfotransferase-like [Branchiostoma belcheri]|uniref:Galactosylceramide sulfotransferase-like n=1 Tax=Branchiostoma belcheri TaxID=7741 RepID=A0A6P4YZV5_BRABE|nr:PREDICTED: galactosylceramide sulfotransferase-like [Branchiostoma belcheri]
MTSSKQDRTLKRQGHYAFIKSSKTCTKKTNLFFLKTHKTGSSTVQNILMRFGSAKNLTFVLPSKGHILGWPRPFHRSFVGGGTKNTIYNILCHHTRFDYKNIRDLMPDDTVYITIVRNPVYMYESVFTYFRFEKQFKINSSEPFKTFLDNPSQFIKFGGKSPMRYRNPMLYDLGKDAKESFSKQEQNVKAYIARLEKIFSVVMIADYFEESLILLKHELCWDIDDVTFLKLNARRDESIRHVTNFMAKKIRKLCNMDTMLFNHFNKTLWSKLLKLPFDWRKEVAVLKEKNHQLQNKCIESDSRERTQIQDGRFKVYEPAGIAMKSFQLKKGALINDTCVNMAKSEKPFTSELRKKRKHEIFQRSI